MIAVIAVLLSLIPARGATTFTSTRASSSLLAMAAPPPTKKPKATSTATPTKKPTATSTATPTSTPIPATASSTPSTGAISGTVSDSTTGLGIANALVSTGSYSATTDVNGAYLIPNVAPGAYVLTATASGYTSASQSDIMVTGGTVTPASFTLSPVPTPTPTATNTPTSTATATSTPIPPTPTSTATNAPQNAIQAENTQPGTANWRITKASTQSNLIEGYANLASANLGGAINFYVNVSPATSYTLEVFRMGWYQGLGARLMTTVGGLAGVAQPSCPIDAATGMVKCNWSASYTLNVPTTWTTGVYLVRLTRSDGYQNDIIFVVRNDSSTAPYLFQSSVTTFEAYNDWGGKSLYGATGADRFNNNLRAYQVSFDRPYTASVRGPYEFLSWEYAMVRWMERRGYDIAYTTDVDTDLSGSLLRQHKAFLSVGHDEYWSKQMRANVEAALAAGVNLGFFGGNDMYWNIRFAPNSLGAADRIMICYKNAQLDPLYNVDNTNVTVRWRDAPLNRPENAVIGEMFSGSVPAEQPGYPFVVTNSSSWVYSGVDVTTNSALPNMVGYEYDRAVNNGSQPAGLTVVSQSPLVDTDGNSDAANATVYTAPSGATVFAAGTIQWVDSLDNYWGWTEALDSRVQAITANVLARLGATPSPTSTPGAGSNLVTNGSFESGSTSWQLVAANGDTTEATWWIDTAAAADGAASHERLVDALLSRFS